MASRSDIRRAGGLGRYMSSKVAEGIATRRAAATIDWFPQEGPQFDAYHSEADELYYGGAAGGGKSDLLLGLALTSHSVSYIFRREAEQLSGLITRSTQIVGRSGNFNSSQKSWNMGGDRLIRFLGCKMPNDWTKYQGQPRDLVGIDELPHFPELTYLMLTAWNRSAKPGQRSRVVACGNPPTDPTGLWILSRWAPWLDRKHPKPAAPGELRWFVRVENRDTEVEPEFGVDLAGDGELVPIAEIAGADVVLDPCRLPRVKVGDRVYMAYPLPIRINEDEDPVVPRSRTFIPALLRDNRYLKGTGYDAVIAAMPEPFRTMLRTGDHFAAIQDDAWQMFPSAWVEAAMARWSPRSRTESLGIDAIGVDIARGGVAETAIARRMGWWFDQVTALPGAKTPTGPEAARVVLEHHSGDAVVIVDVGGPGSSAYDSLAAAVTPGPGGLRVEAFNGAGATKERCKHGVLRFRNIRAAAHWKLREALDPESGCDVALPPDDELKADLLGIRYEIKPGGVIQVDDKQELVDATGRGFHKSDAVIMAAWQSSGLLEVDASVSQRFWGSGDDQFDVGERW